MKLTKKQRHMAYMIMLAELQTVIDKDSASLCEVYETITGEIPYISESGKDTNGAVIVNGEYQHGFEYYLPELWAKRTTDRWTACWYKNTKYGYNKRIAILKQCIAETYYKF